jgi:hypothetical protein
MNRRRRDTDPYFALVGRLRSRVRRALAAGYKSDRAGLIDYAAIALHLGPRPGPGHHVGHIRPLRTFDLTDSEQIRLAFAPENHRWRPARGGDL